MKPRVRKQRVILREKVRKERWKWFTNGVFRWVFRSILIAAIGFAFVRANRFLFHSSFFMVKSLTVIPGENPRMSSKIQRQLESLKGNSIFSFSADNIEEDLKERFSSIRSINIMRTFPDHIEVRYELRKPIAIVKTESDESDFSHKVKFLDETGTIYTQEVFKESLMRFPEVVASSTHSLVSASQFLKSWSKESSNSSIKISSGSLCQLKIDSWGEANLTIRQQENQNSDIQIVWGRTDSASFSEKFKRLEQVMADLREKNVSAEYVNLRQVPEEIPLTLGNKKIVGRVIVRPAAGAEPNQLKG